MDDKKQAFIDGIEELQEHKVSLRNSQDENYLICLHNIEFGLQRVSTGYLIIALNLYNVYAKQYFFIDNFANIADFALEKFGIKKTQCHNYLRLVQRFGEWDAIEATFASLKPEWQPFSKSQLIAMLSLSDAQLLLVQPDWTVSRIKALAVKPDTDLDINPVSVSSSDVQVTPDRDADLPEMSVMDGRVTVGIYHSFNDIVVNRKRIESVLDDMRHDPNFKDKKISLSLELVYE